MAQLLRIIKNYSNYFDYNKKIVWLTGDELPSAFLIDFIASNNSTSFFRINDDNDLKKVIIAFTIKVFRSRKTNAISVIEQVHDTELEKFKNRIKVKVSEFQFLLADEKTIKKAGFKLENKDWDSSITEANTLHVQIDRLTATKLVLLVKSFLGSKPAGNVKPPKQIKTMLIEYLKRQDLKQELRKELENISASIDN